MKLQWNDNLAIDIEDIDEQHKEIFKRVNNLLSAIEESSAKIEVSKILKYLSRYVVDHFHAEECIMIKHNYSYYKNHKDEHILFTKDFSELERDFEKYGVTPELLQQIQWRLCNWLLDHISKEDKKIGHFLKKRQ